MLGLVCQVCGSVLPLRNPRIRITGTQPLFIRRFLVPFPVHPRQIFSARRLHPRLLCQFGEKLLIAGPAVPPDDGTDGRIGFQRCCIHAYRLAFQQTTIGQYTQHPQEHFPVRFHIDQPPGSGDGGVIGRVLVQADAQKTAQAQRIGSSPRDPPFRIDTFEIANQQQAEVYSRRQRWTPVVLRVELRAFGFGKLVELLPIQHLVQARVERMAWSGGQFGMRDPQLFLPLPVFARSHRHRNILGLLCFRRQEKPADRARPRPDFRHGLLMTTWRLRQ